MVKCEKCRKWFTSKNRDGWIVNGRDGWFCTKCAEQWERDEMNARAAARMDNLMAGGMDKKTAQEISGWKL